MNEKIRVLIADDIKDARDNIKTLLSFDPRFIIAGEAENGEQSVICAEQVDPDVILMDINMPVMDGIKATEVITGENPGTSIIMMSVQNDREYLHKAMAAGARDYITKPFTGDELVSSIIKVYEIDLKRKSKIAVKKEDHTESKVITVFSTKGGVGKTTIASNLAVGIARQTRKKVALLDLDVFFGDVAVQLNINVRNTLSDLIKDISNLDVNLLEEFMMSHFSGVKILPAPLKPEYAEYITASHIEKIIKIARERYSYIILDTSQNFNEITLAALDASDIILFLTSMDLTSIKNTKTGLEVMESLKYSKEKLKIIINRGTEQYGIKYKDAELTLNSSIFAIFPDDQATVTNSLNKGIPFVLSRLDSRISKTMMDTAHKLLYDNSEKNVKVAGSQLKKLFGQWG